MTHREAKELCLELWRYLEEHPEVQWKHHVPPELWKKILYLDCECPLCELFSSENSFCEADEGDEDFDGCEGCPLFEAGEECLRDRSAYKEWSHSLSSDCETRKKAAHRIVEIVSAWEPEEEQ
jgi:hypothetical protein